MNPTNNAIYDTIHRSRSGLVEIQSLLDSLKSFRTKPKLKINIPAGTPNPYQLEYLRAELHHAREALRGIPSSLSKWQSMFQNVLDFRTEAMEVLDQLGVSLKQMSQRVRPFLVPKPQALTARVLSGRPS